MKTKNDSNKVNLLNKIYSKYRIRSNFDTAILYAKRALEISDSIQIGSKKAWPKGQCTSHLNIGNVNSRQGNYAEALKHFFEALKIAESISDKAFISNSIMNIGNVYERQNNLLDALKYYTDALKIAQEINEKKVISATYSNMGNVFFKQKKFTESIQNHQRALKMREEQGDRLNVAYSWMNIGNVYAQQKMFEKALNNYFAALKIEEEIGNRGGMNTTICNIANVYKEQKKYKLSEEYFKKGLLLSQEMKILELQSNVNQALSEVYSATGRYKEALDCFKAFKSGQDSLLNQENTKKTVQMKMNYEFSKKEEALKLEQEKRDAISKEESRKQKILVYSVSTVLFLVFILGLVIYRNLRLNQKKNKIITHQKHLVEEKHKEIRDSINYAERIQRALLASKKLLSENLNSYFILFIPKDVVSGDFYWAMKLKTGNFVVVTADSTGHGVPGAIMSILNMACLKEAVIQGITSPDLLLNETRKLIIDNLKNDGSDEGGKDGMDASLLSFDLKNNVLTVASANNPIWIIRGNDLIIIKPDRMPVGKHDKDKIPFTLHTQNLQKGDMIYTLTDGFSDQFGGIAGKKFKMGELQKLLLSISHEPMENQKQKLHDFFNDWKGNLEQVDDVCLIGVRV